MRVLFVSNLFPPAFLGGYELECAQVAEHLHALGHEVAVISTQDPNNQSSSYPFSVYRTMKLIKDFTIPIHRTERINRWKTSNYNYNMTQKAIEDFSPDCVFLWSMLRIGVGPAFAAQDAGIPIAWRFGDENIAGFRSTPKGKTPISFLKHLIDEHILKRSTISGLNFTHTSCISQLTKKRLIESGIPIQKAEIHYKGIPIELFPMKKNPGKLSQPLKILHVGQLHDYKGVFVLQKAIDLLALSIPVELTYIGSGPKEIEERLHHFANKSQAKVTFKGKLPYESLGAEYRQYDIFIFPSLWEEPQGTSYLEAMASGVPVISTSNGGQKEILENGKTALFYDKDNPKALLQQVEKVTHNNTLRQELVSNARALVEQNYSLNTYVKQIETFLKSACTHKEKANESVS